MPDVKQCSICGAQNAAKAEWCTLCLTRFDGRTITASSKAAEAIAELSDLAAIEVAPAPVQPATPIQDLAPLIQDPAPLIQDPAPLIQEVVPPVQVVAPTSTVGDISRTAPPEIAPSRDVAPPHPKISAPPPPAARESAVKFTRDGERVQWICPACETRNDVESNSCRICGTVLANLFAPPEEPKPKPGRSSGKAMAWSAVLPGLGHLYAGAGPAGVSRVVLYIWTLGVSILLLTRAPARGHALVQGVGAVFAIAAAGVWLMSLIEAGRLAEGDKTPVLSPRQMTWFSGGLTLTLFLGLAAAAFGK